MHNSHTRSLLLLTVTVATAANRGVTVLQRKLMTIRIRCTFSSIIRPNTNNLFGPNRIRIEYSVQP